MLEINGQFIEVDVKQALQDLKVVLAENKGIEVFRVTKDTDRNIQTICPFHKHGQEKKPSFGVNKNTGLCHCFTCGYSATLDVFISNLFGREDFGIFGLDWLKRNYNSFSIETRKELNLNLSRNVVKQEIKYVSEQELDSYRYIHPYMYKRGLTDEIIERFDIGFDKDTGCITFPVLDINGRCLFVARRSVNYKYFNYPESSQKPIYLAYEINKGIYDECYICESFLNALTLWKYNKPAVALLGTGSVNQYDILKKLPVRKYILALDPDEAGEKGTKKLYDKLHKHKVLSRLIYPDSRDINDLQEEVLNLRQVLI